MTAPDVRHDRSGQVTVGGVQVAPRVHTYNPYELRLFVSVRQRTSDDRWRQIADILAAEQEASTWPPLGAGVDFFLDEDPTCLAVDQRTRDEIQFDATEAAREAIMDGIAAHVRRQVPALVALRRWEP